MTEMETIAYNAGLNAFSGSPTRAYGNAEMQAAYKRGMADRNRKLWLELLGQGSVLLLFVGWICLGKYASPGTAIFIIGIGCLVGAALKVAEWRRTWPFGTFTAPLASNSQSPVSDPAYRDACTALRPTKTRCEFAEEYQPYNAMPEFSEGTMAYLAGNRRNPYPEKGVQAQAWDRGRECCSRYEDQEGREEGGRPW
jgi:hypothetical protein